MLELVLARKTAWCVYIVTLVWELGRKGEQIN